MPYIFIKKVILILQMINVSGVEFGNCTQHKLFFYPFIQGTLSILELLDLVLEYISLKVWVVVVLRQHLFAGFPGSNLHQMRYKPLFIVLQTLYWLTKVGCIIVIVARNLCHWMHRTWMMLIGCGRCRREWCASHLNH